MCGKGSGSLDGEFVLVFVCEMGGNKLLSKNKVEQDERFVVKGCFVVVDVDEQVD